MINFPTVSEFTEEYLRDNPEEIDSFVSVLFEEYGERMEMLLHCSLPLRIRAPR